MNKSYVEYQGDYHQKMSDFIGDFVSSATGGKSLRQFLDGFEKRDAYPLNK